LDRLLGYRWRRYSILEKVDLESESIGDEVDQFWLEGRGFNDTPIHVRQARLDSEKLCELGEIGGEMLEAEEPVDR